MDKECKYCQPGDWFTIGKYTVGFDGENIYHKYVYRRKNEENTTTLSYQISYCPYCGRKLEQNEL